MKTNYYEIEKNIEKLTRHQPTNFLTFNIYKEVQIAWMNFDYNRLIHVVSCCRELRRKMNVAHRKVSINRVGDMKF